LNHNKIQEIKGLDNLESLRELRLNDNQITELKGLRSLEKLESLWLANNQINEIKNLESLSALNQIDLYNNKIPLDIVEKCRDLSEKAGIVLDAQKCVEYCRKNKKKV